MNLICNFNVNIKITNLATYVNENFPNIKIFIDVSSGGLSKRWRILGLSTFHLCIKSWTTLLHFTQQATQV